MARKQVGGIMDMIEHYANKATYMAKEGFDAAKTASGLDGESEEEKRRKKIAQERAASHAAGVRPHSHTLPSTYQSGGKRKRRRTKRKGGMCGVCTGGSRKGGRKTKRKRGGKKTHKKRGGRSALTRVRRMVERYL